MRKFHLKDATEQQRAELGGTLKEKQEEVNQELERKCTHWNATRYYAASEKITWGLLSRVCILSSAGEGGIN